MTFAQQLERAMQSHGLSQGKAARLLGVSRPTIANWLKGRPDGSEPPTEPVLTQAQILADLERLAKQREK